MRVVWVGLIGVVLGVGVAEAGASCPLLGATLTASAGPNSYGEYLYGIRPTTKAFHGKRFAVSRVTRVRNMTLNPATGTMRDVGYEAVSLRGPTGPLIIREQKVIGAPPQWVFSRPRKDAPSIRWGQGPLWRVKAGEKLWVVQEGPLAGYSMKVSACPPRRL